MVAKHVSRLLLDLVHQVVGLLEQRVQVEVDQAERQLIAFADGYLAEPEIGEGTVIVEPGQGVLDRNLPRFPGLPGDPCFKAVGVKLDLLFGGIDVEDVRN